MTRIFPAIKNYDWGARDALNPVYHLSGSTARPFRGDIPYAEAWLGAHPSGPATLPSGAPLAPNTTPSFLLKVLAVRKSLSLQVHPSTPAAVALRSSDPAHFPDDRAKPELVVALSPMRLFCGFAPPVELRHRFCAQFSHFASAFCQAAPAVAARLTAETSDAAAELTTFLLYTTPDIVLALLSALKTDLPEPDANGDLRIEVTRELLRDFPGDVGVLLSLALRLEELAPLEALAVSPRVPHAYLHGDAVECMGASDNVVRAGLTAKHCDIRTFCALTDFVARPGKLCARETTRRRNFTVYTYDAGFEGLFKLGRLSSATWMDEIEVLEVYGTHVLGVNLGDAVEVNGENLGPFECFHAEGRTVITVRVPCNVALFYACGSAESA